MSFLLDKYYFDAVAPDGRSFIGYSAVLKWGLLKMRYHGGIWSDTNGEVRVVDRYFTTALPRENGDVITWSSPLGSGEWRGAIKHTPKTLFSGWMGAIDWELYQDRAVAHIPEGPFGAIIGLGYSERLRMTRLPWHAPIKVLHWGRFHGEHTTLVWIRWEGPVPLLMLRLNGVEHSDGHVDEEGVHVAGLELRFGRNQVLRDGTLRQNLFGGKRWPGVVFPTSVLDIDEKKYVSRCTVTEAGVLKDEGWAIHEIVTWP